MKRYTIYFKRRTFNAKLKWSTHLCDAKLTDKEARLTLLELYIKMGYRVVKIEREVEKLS